MSKLGRLLVLDITQSQYQWEPAMDTTSASYQNLPTGQSKLRPSTLIHSRSYDSQAFVIDEDGTSPSVEQNLPKSRPCDACRKRKSRCVVNEGASKCVLCEFHNQRCTYLEVPQSRKRKSVNLEDEIKSLKKK